MLLSLLQNKNKSSYFASQTDKQPRKYTKQETESEI